MNKLFFDKDVYKQEALNTSKNNMNIHSYIDSFFLLINGLDYEELSVLCDRMYEEFISLYGDNNISKNVCYEMTQNLNLNSELKKIIVSIATGCMDKGLYLGTKMSAGYNTSAWLNHSYRVGECCASLALIIGVDVERARTYGLLHDFGRKKDFRFKHVIYGYQDLYDLGYKDEAIACLTHSFLNGGRCSNNEKAVDGFYVDEEGNPRWREEASFDDIKLFLDNYQYNDYDKILNIADLMAKDMEIVSPYDRIADIATRRELDPINRGYFLADFTNVLIDILKGVGSVGYNFPYIKASSKVSLSEIENYFKKVSECFFDTYNKLLNEQTSKKTL